MGYERREARSGRIRTTPFAGTRKKRGGGLLDLVGMKKRRRDRVKGFAGGASLGGMLANLH